MREISGISDQLKASFDGEAWHGPAVRELLEGVTAKEAAAHPVAGGHSIWELVFHIAAWENAVRERLAGDSGEVPDSVNFPEVRDPSEDAWRQAREALDSAHEALVVAVQEFPDSRLEEMVPGNSYTFYKLLHGVVEHNLYHAGQIALLKKAEEIMAANGRE